ncbi:hypothetical protein AAG570_003834 [Ranatra chinensis]|uniref:Uncharacterized protein n=1 Tax=Ranatra chinensis TaxID=642074 RepID=A0ABD0YQI3_9HEMI
MSYGHESMIDNWHMPLSVVFCSVVSSNVIQRLWAILSDENLEAGNKQNSRNSNGTRVFGLVGFGRLVWSYVFRSSLNEDSVKICSKEGLFSRDIRRHDLYLLIRFVKIGLAESGSGRGAARGGRVESRYLRQLERWSRRLGVLSGRYSMERSKSVALGHCIGRLVYLAQLDTPAAIALGRHVRLLIRLIKCPVPQRRDSYMDNVARVFEAEYAQAVARLAVNRQTLYEERNI